MCLCIPFFTLPSRFCFVLFCFFIPNLKKEWHMVQKKTDGLEMPTGYRRRLRITFGSPLLVSQLPFQLPAERKKGKHRLDLNHLLTAALTNSSSRLSVAILAAEEPQACFVFVFLEIVSFLFVLSVLQVFLIEPRGETYVRDLLEWNDATIGHALFSPIRLRPNQ